MTTTKALVNEGVERLRALGFETPRLDTELLLAYAIGVERTAVVANGRTAQKVAVRARILMMLADHVRPSHIAARLALSRNHVHYWLRRYVAQGVSGVLRDASRPGRKKRITPAQVAAK